MSEFLYKSVMTIVFNTILGLLLAFILMILLNEFFPLLSYWQWFLWALAGMAVSNAGHSTAEFRQNLDNIVKR